MGRVLMYVLPIALAIYALVDCIQTDDDKVRHLPKIAWIVLIVLTAFSTIGPIAWLIAGRERGHGQPRLRPSTSPPIAPDDNPEFLNRLNDDVRRNRPKKRDDDPDEQPGSDRPKR